MKSFTLEVWGLGTEPNEAAIFLPNKHFLIRRNFHLQLLSVLSEAVESWVVLGSCGLVLFFLFPEVKGGEGGATRFGIWLYFILCQSLLCPCQAATNRQPTTRNSELCARSSTRKQIFCLSAGKCRVTVLKSPAKDTLDGDSVADSDWRCRASSAYQLNGVSL